MAETTTLEPLTREQKTALDPRTDADILTEALHRFTLAADAEHDERVQQLEAVRFHAGENATGQMRNTVTGEPYPLPTMRIDRQSAYIHQVVNSYRKNPLGIRVRPRSGGAQKQTAELIEGVVRDIESTSEADQAYGNALFWATAYGTGYLRLCTAWKDTYSFEQTLEIKPVPNRFSVYKDPSSVHPAGLDANWYFITDRLLRDEFMAMHGTQPPSPREWQGMGDSAWVDAETVQVADYMYRVWDTTELVQLPNGTVLPTEGLSDLDPAWPRREARIPIVYWVQLCGWAVLSKTRWLGMYCPVIQVEGDRIDVDGRIQRTGVIQQTMSAQLAHDYAFSAEMEALALAPKAPYILAAEQISGYESYWNRANDAYLPYLPYRPREGIPPPQRQVVEPAIQALSVARQQAAADMQAALGVFQASMGEESNERSGTAVRARKIEGDQATYHYPANLAWSIRAVGIQIVDILPKLYSRPTELRQLGKDGTVKMTKVNQRAPNDAGQVEEHLLARGQYDVAIDSGPAYSTQREMAAERLGELGRVLPPEMIPMVADLWVGSLDIPYAEELAARLKTAVPPQALEATKEMDPRNQIVTLQNQLKQATDALQMLQQQAQEAQQQSQVAVQQVALLEKANADLKIRLDNKQQELQVDAQKAQWDFQINTEKNAIDWEELRLKYGLGQPNGALMPTNGVEDRRG